MNEIIPGCWIEIEDLGEAVCTDVQTHKCINIEYGISKEKKLYSFRYESIRCCDNKTIWVQDAIFEDDDVKYLKEQDSLSQYVLTLSGPYGED
jgi:hypothetical protein